MFECIFIVNIIWRYTVSNLYNGRMYMSYFYNKKYFKKSFKKFLLDVVVSNLFVFYFFWIKLLLPGKKGT